MKAIQLDLFTGATIAALNPALETTSPAVEKVTTVNEACPRHEVSGTLLVDPCKGCPLRELCSPDDCGRKLYDIDMAEPPYMDFKDWVDGVFE